MKLQPNDLAEIAARTIQHYDQHAEEFREGTRDHDVSQNIAALLRHIEGEPPFTILDFGCGPGRDLKAFADLGHRAIGLEGAVRFAAAARAATGCTVWQQDFLALDLPDEHFHGIFANAALFHVPSQRSCRASFGNCMPPSRPAARCSAPTRAGTTRKAGATGATASITISNRGAGTCRTRCSSSSSTTTGPQGCRRHAALARERLAQAVNFASGCGLPLGVTARLHGPLLGRIHDLRASHRPMAEMDPMWIQGKARLATPSESNRIWRGGRGTPKAIAPAELLRKSGLEVVPDPSPAVVELGTAIARALVAALAYPEVRGVLAEVLRKVSRFGVRAWRWRANRPGCAAFLGLSLFLRHPSRPTPPHPRPPRRAKPMRIEIEDPTCIRCRDKDCYVPKESDGTCYVCVRRDAQAVERLAHAIGWYAKRGQWFDATNHGWTGYVRTRTCPIASSRPRTFSMLRKRLAQSRDEGASAWTGACNGTAADTFMATVRVPRGDQLAREMGSTEAHALANALFKVIALPSLDTLFSKPPTVESESTEDAWWRPEWDREERGKRTSPIASRPVSSPSRTGARRDERRAPRTIVSAGWWSRDTCVW